MLKFIGVLLGWAFLVGALYLVFWVFCPWFAGLIPAGEWHAILAAVVYLAAASIVAAPVIYLLIFLFALTAALFMD